LRQRIRIVVEPHIECRAASSLAAAEKFEPHLPSFAGGSGSHTDSDVAETNLGPARQCADDEPERAARFGGELPAPEPALVFEVVAREHRAHARGSQRLIDGPFQLPPIGAAHEQHTPPLDHGGEARRMKRIVAVDDDQRPVVGHRASRGSQGAGGRPMAEIGGEPLDERAATEPAGRQQPIQLGEAAGDGAPSVRRTPLGDPLDFGTKMFDQRRRHTGPAARECGSMLLA